MRVQVRPRGPATVKLKFLPGLSGPKGDTGSLGAGGESTGYIRAPLLMADKDLFGKMRDATALSIIANRGTDTNRDPLILGDFTDGHFAWYEDFDTVGAYFENRLRKPTRIPFVVFELNSFYIASDASGAHVVGGATQYHSELRVGMFVRAETVPEKRARITGWDTERIYVGGWVNKGSSSSGEPVVYHDPTGTAPTGLEINPQTKGWTVNANYFVNSDVADPLPRGAIAEFGIGNFKADSPYLWGYDLTNLANPGDADPAARGFYAGIGFIVRERWMVGFRSYGQRDSGFHVKHHLGVNPAEGGFRYDANTGPSFVASTSATSGVDQYGHPIVTARHVYFQIGNETDPVLIGRNNVAQNREVWFRSGGGGRDFDSVLLALGGDPALNGGGALAAAAVDFRVYDSNRKDHVSLRGAPLGSGGTITVGSDNAAASLVLTSKGSGLARLDSGAAGGSIQIASTTDRPIGFFGSGGAVRQAATDISSLLVALRAYGLIAP